MKKLILITAILFMSCSEKDISPSPDVTYVETYNHLLSFADQGYDENGKFYVTLYVSRVDETTGKRIVESAVPRNGETTFISINGNSVDYRVISKRIYLAGSYIMGSWIEAYVNESDMVYSGSIQKYAYVNSLGHITDEWGNEL